ncbi:MAG: hypothetical protein BWY82_00462 [Verrucomicrobia bacterium ADurb.Bin474]|nr:MAG: hypothetical protein BWY82_00462 [Verrucomicrobia bacterium ADurb.Bin474]
MDPLPMGSGSMDENVFSSSSPKASFSVRLMLSKGSGLTWSRRLFSSSMRAGGRMSGRVVRIWPILMKVGPRSSNTMRMRVHAVRGSSRRGAKRSNQLAGMLI